MGNLVRKAAFYTCVETTEYLSALHRRSKDVRYIAVERWKKVIFRFVNKKVSATMVNYSRREICGLVIFWQSGKTIMQVVGVFLEFVNSNFFF